MTAKVLTIDDDPAIRLLVSTYLSTSGYEVFEAENGRDGLRLAEEESVDLILLDKSMPEMNGLEVVRRLKENPSTRQTPVLMLTGLGSQQDKVNGLDAGADEYITKPVGGQELLARVRALLRMSALQKEVVRLEHQRHEEQLQFAGEVQKSLLPARPPQIPGADIALTYQPCETIGGDFYDYVSDGNRLCMVLGDAEGHGVSASLLMARAGAYVRSSLSRDDFSPARLLANVNRLLCRDHATDVVLPMLAFFLDMEKGTFFYANAGHVFPILYKASEDTYQRLESTSPMLGVQVTEYFEEVRISVEEGDVLFCFTDAVSEGANDEGEFFGDERIIESLKKHVKSDASALVEGVLNEWRQFIRNEVADDVTVLAVRMEALVELKLCE